MEPANPAEILKIADFISAKSDRWMFVFILVFLLVVGMWILKYLVEQNQRLVNQHEAANKEYSADMRKIASESNETARSLAVVLGKNNDVITECTNELRRFRESK